VQSLGSERMQRIFTGLMGEMRILMAQMHYRQELRASVIVEEHDAILAAIEAGDPDGAAQAMRDHLYAARDRRLLAVERHSM